MKFLYTILSICFISTSLFAQSDSTHWTQLINQPQLNYFKIKTAFEKEQKQFLQSFIANNSTISKDSISTLQGTKEGFYNIFKRWEYFILPRLDKNGDFDATKEAINFKSYLDNIDSKNKRQINAANWQPIGPFKATSTSYANSGRVECVAFHPTDVNTFYIGAPSGGVWKTTDGGLNWQYLTQNWDDQNITALAINPSNPLIIFALKYRNYLIKSSDGGVTWSQINITGGYYAMNKILINPNNPQIMLANTFDGTLRSTDGGITWTKSAFSGTSSIEDIKFKPNDPTVVYATSSKVVYKSIDAGISFTAIYTLPTNSIAANIAVTAAAPNNLYVAYNSNLSLNMYYSKFGAIYKSTDGGSTFSTITDDSTPVASQTMGNVGYHQGRYDLTLAVSPTNADDIWLGIVPSFRTTNGGLSWVYSGSSSVSVHVDHHAAEYQPISGKLFIGCDGGLYRFTPATNAYEILEGMNITQIYRIAGLKNLKGKIMYGAQDNGTHKWESNIFKNVFGGDGMECIIDHTNNNTIYGSYQNGSLTKSINNGTSTIDITPNPFPSNAQWVTPWEMDPNNSQTMYSCYKEVYKTTNGGTSWTAVTNFNLNQSVRFVKIAPSNSNALYAFSGGYYGTTSIFMKSSNAGTSWSTLTLPVANFQATDMTISATDPNKIWVIGQSKVYHSIDGGVSWTDITGTLPAVGLNCILLDKSSGDLYVGTGSGVFVRLSTGTDWVLFNDGLPKVNIQELEISYIDGNILRAGTYGRGLWETLVSTPCTTPLASITAGGSTIIPGGGSVTLQANIGSGLTYQWFKDGLQIVGSTLASYVANDIGEYSVLVKTANCSKTSNTIIVTTSATLNLVPIPPVVCKGNLSIPFTATNFAVGTVFTADLTYNGGGNDYVQFTVSGTSSPLIINIPSYYNMTDTYKIKLRASSPSLSVESSTFQVKSVETGIGNANGNVFANGSPSLTLCTGKSIKLYALKFNNLMPSSTFSYQWKLNGTDIGGATDSTIVASQAGNYSVVMSQAGCVQTLPQVNISYSTNVYAYVRSVGYNTQCTNVMLETLYTTPTATFQWKKDGVNIPAANSFSYNATSSGVYALIISDGAGCTIYPNNLSREVKIGKLQALITSSDTLMCTTNGYAYISLNNSTSSYDNPPSFASGVTYQWQRNGIDIANSNQNYWYASSGQDGLYSLKVKQQGCEAISNSFYVKSAAILPIYAKSGTVGTNFCSGQSIYLYGSGYGTFTWQKDGVDVLNSISYNATTTGTYTLKRVQGACTSISAPIALTFGNSVVPVIQVSYNLSKACTFAYLYVYSTPSGSTFQWRRNGVNIGGNQNFLYVTSSGNYDVVVISGTCSGTSDLLPITIGSIEGEIMSAYSALYCKNSVKKLSLNKVNYDNSQLQWKKNGVNILGATLPEYLADAPGNYSVAITQGTCSYETPAFNIPVRLISTGTLSGNTTITGGQTGTITANLTGISPWAITLSDGSVQCSTVTPFSMNVSPSTTQTYTIQSMTDGCSWGCIPTWNLSATSTTNAEIYHAQQTISSVSSITTPINMEYKAGNNILLSPGFKVQNGAIFKAEIGGCN
jgi:photosystem II stability/assembly factor-like uncharacterized protein